ncbi:hypothetical protein [Butyrivibrio sp. AE3006]|uniref:hypothetical protein n=1 Tax=Butyrivibrio sp. AE3006 TaxID=1280673 RepID=UPI0003F5604E|nr:hypothetical protein [Butyrivibrio sp. AE3006]
MKSVMKKVLLGVSALSFAMLLTLCSGVKAEAKVTTKYPTAYCLQAPNNGYLLRVGEDRQYIVDVKTSNKNVVSLSPAKKGGSGTNYNANRPGTCTITYTMERNGKRYKATQKYIVVRKRPYKQVKLNGKDITKTVNQDKGYKSIKCKTEEYTLSWKVASDLKVCKPDRVQEGSGFSGESLITKKSGTKKFSGRNFHHIYLKDKKGHYLGTFLFYITQND